MCVTPGASIARVDSSAISAPSRLSNSRAPSPRRIGTTWICISSISPAFRYCWAMFAPPPRRTSLPPAASLACSRADSMPSVTKVKVVPPSLVTGLRAWGGTRKHGWVEGDDEPRGVEGRVVSPPAVPGVSSPWAAAPEHVPAHHGRAEVFERFLDDGVGSIDLATLLAVGPAPGLEAEDPLV